MIHFSIPSPSYRYDARLHFIASLLASSLNHIVPSLLPRKLIYFAPFYSSCLSLYCCRLRTQARYIISFADRIRLSSTSFSMLWRSVCYLCSICCYHNEFQIADRLCSSFGQDILDCVFSRSTLLLLSRNQPISSRSFRPLLFFLISIVYTGELL